MLLTDEDLRGGMGQYACQIPAPYVTWENKVTLFAQALNIDPGD